MLRTVLSIAILAVLPRLANAQTGDRPGETQVAQIPADRIPPAPPLPPARALKSFKLQGEFEIQLVASEPMIENPVMLRWDARGRLWVLEMRAFMDTPDGAGELRRNSRLLILHDDDGDGRADRRTVFLDKLLMPRALAFTRGGVLVCEPPALSFYPILEGDRPGPARVVDPDYAPRAAPVDGKLNIEHAVNGLARGLDNWFYSAKSTSRYRYVDEEWKKETTYFKGQWGICQDNYGRLVFNSNSDHFRMEPVPSEYLLRNPFHRGATWSIQPLPSQIVWPGRMNPGVNRAYKPGFLRPDGTMKRFTAASGIAIYRGAHFPPEFLGDAFVPEPAGNLLRRDDVSERHGRVTAVNPYEKRQTEFLVSTDEIFRPVNVHMGPDGALYLVDMYHGIIQHHAHLTSYLRRQAESRGLDKVTNYGRIYRIVHKSRPLDKGPDLARASIEQRVAALDHPNGWYRDTAQRLLVDQASPRAVAPLKRFALEGGTHLGRLHALWTLEGLGYIDLDLLRSVLKQERHGKVRAAAIRLCDPILKTWEQDEALQLVLSQLESPDPDVRLQLALTLSGVQDPKAIAALVRLARDHADNVHIRDAIISGRPGNEAGFVAALAKDTAFHQHSRGREQLVGDLARCVITQSRREPVNALLFVAAEAPAPLWFKRAIVTGMTPPKIPPTPGLPPARRKRVRLPERPAALEALAKIPDESFRKALAELDEILLWPGKPGVQAESPPRPLTASERQRFEAGRRLYELTCGNCHRPHGFGMPGLAPPLADSEWIAASPERLVRIVTHGMTGPVTVLGKRYNMNMPGHASFTDEQIAAVLTYIRRAWDHPYDPVTPGQVAEARRAVAGREHAWTAAELLHIK